MERKRMSRREWDLLFQRNVLGRLLTRRITFTTIYYLPIYGVKKQVTRKS